MVSPGKSPSISYHTTPLSLFDPLVGKLYLEFPAPTPNHNISDTDRLIREVGKSSLTLLSFQVSLDCLQNLAENLDVSMSGRLPPPWPDMMASVRILQIEGGDTTDRNYGLAVDVGTTTAGSAAGSP